MKQQRAKTVIELAIERIGSVPSVIIHTIIFAGFTALALWGTFPRDLVLLVWNTLVSLEAIYLALFIQITVNSNTASLREVEEDIDEIQEDVEELGEDVEDIQEDIEEISEDIDEMQEDIEEISEEDEERPQKLERIEERALGKAASIEKLADDLARILAELEQLKKGK